MAHTRCDRRSFPPRWMRPLALAMAVVGCAFQVGAPPAVAAVSQRQIQETIDKAVSHLRGIVARQEHGRLGIITLALLKAGVPADAPEVKSAIDIILRRFDSSNRFITGADHNYDAGVTLMALANADPVKYKPQIAAIASFLIERQGSTGEWDYPHRMVSGRSDGDTSISQYAILGLWEAARAGVEIPSGVWDRAAEWHMRTQLRDGGFTYHPSPSPEVVSSPPSHTMTVAGTSSLLVARLHLFGDAAVLPDLEERSSGRKKSRRKFGLLEPLVIDADDDSAPAALDKKPDSGPVVTRLSNLDRSVGRGRKWLGDRFEIMPATVWKTYYLYGIERLAALAGLKEIAGHDWYEEGAEWLVRNQNAAGSWDDSCGIGASAAFGVMFLVKATEKTLYRPVRRRDPRFGGGLLVGGRGLPENLNDVQLDKGSVKVRKLKGPIDELLAELENAQSEKVEAAQQAIVEQVATEDPEALIGQAERLLRLKGDPRVEVRRTVFWALGRTNDYRVAPVLIEGLSDPDLSCMIEARNALRYLSKRINDIDPPDEPTEAERAAAIAQWRRWYQTVRPYDERDDLTAN